MHTKSSSINKSGHIQVPPKDYWEAKPKFLKKIPGTV